MVRGTTIALAPGAGAADCHSVPEPLLLTREQALRRRMLRRSWYALAAGLIVPPFALFAIHGGLTVRRTHPRQGLALAVLGAAVFVVRAALYLH